MLTNTGVTNDNQTVVSTMRITYSAKIRESYIAIGYTIPIIVFIVVIGINILLVLEDDTWNKRKADVMAIGYNVAISIKDFFIGSRVP